MKLRSRIFSCIILAVFLFSTLVILVSCSPRFGEWQITKQPTCTEDGEMIRYQIKDGAKFEVKAIPAEGHLYSADGGWETLVEPTHTSEGERRRVCARCGYVEIESIDILQSAYHIDIMDGGKLLNRLFIEEDGLYEIDGIERVGYELGALKDEDGNDFPASGQISDNRVIDVIWNILPTRTFEELSERLSAGVDKIFVDGDIVMTDSVYVVGNTEMYVEKDCTITRSADFYGDMFIIGENADGENSFLANGKNASLVLKTYEGASLMFDGNKDNISDDVKGTCFLVLYSSVVNMYDGVTVQNFKKTANDKIANGEYKISYPQKIGGAGMIVVNGTFNMYGGSFVGNEVNTDETFEGDDSESDSARVSSCGGAIYNYAGVNIYAGTFEGNSAARGGAIYNYRETRIIGGTFTSNTASVYAGAVYLPGSQYSALHIGNPSGEGDIENPDVLFNLNTAGKSGGAIFGQMKNSVSIYGGTAFKNNTAIGYNGGAINTSGALIVVDALFEGNISASKGGAVYAYYSNPELTTRQVDIQKGTFKNNRASKGGAIAFSALSTEFERGSIGFIGNVSFVGNEAYATTTDDPELPDSGDEEENASVEKNYNGNGGAIYVSRKSSLTVKGSASFTSNSADRNGGAIYITGESELNLERPDDESAITFENNSCGINGGAIYAHGEKTFVRIGDWTDIEPLAESDETDENQTKSVFVVFKSNTAENKGGAMYVTNGSGAVEDMQNAVYVKIDCAKFESNTSGGNGGAIYCYTDARLDVKNSQFVGNSTTSTAQGGGAVYLTKTTANITDSVFTSNSAVNMNGGAIGVYSNSVLNIVRTAFNENKTLSDGANGGGALYLSGSTVNIDDCTFTENTSAQNGGAIGAYSASNVTFNGNNVFTSNTSAKNGGAVYVASADTSLTFNGNNVFDSNRAETSGGAIYVASEGDSLTFNDTVEFSSNSANTYGGAIYVTGPSTIDIEFVTATNNSASQGGFIYLTKTNTKVTIMGGSATGNTASSAGNAFCGNATKAYLIVKGTAEDTAFKVNGENVTQTSSENGGKFTVQYIE